MTETSDNESRRSADELQELNRKRSEEWRRAISDPDAWKKAGLPAPGPDGLWHLPDDDDIREED